MTLQVGMLLLDPGDGPSARPTIWTVASKSTVIAHYGEVAAKATLRKPGVLPEGWRIINNRPLAQSLTEQQRAAAD